MLWGDLQRPGEVGRLPEQLLVEVVAKTTDTLGKQDPRGGTVGQAGDVRPGSPGNNGACDHSRGDAAPDAEAALPDGEDAPPLVWHLVPARDNVVDPRADDPPEHAPHGHPVDEIPAPALADPKRPGNDNGDDDAEEQHQPVDADRQRPQLDDVVCGARDAGEHGAHSPKFDLGITRL